MRLFYFGCILQTHIDTLFFVHNETNSGYIGQTSCTKFIINIFFLQNEVKAKKIPPGRSRKIKWHPTYDFFQRLNMGEMDFKHFNILFHEKNHNFSLSTALQTFRAAFSSPWRCRSEKNMWDVTVAHQVHPTLIKLSFVLWKMSWI